MIPIAVPNLGGNEAAYLRECIDTAFVSTVGPFVGRFEEMVAAAAGTRGAVATSSGTTGLHLALTTLGVGRDDLVILPSFTFIASANATAHCGATPWLIDVEARSWTLDPTLLAQALASETARDGARLVHRPSGRRVAAMMPVHTLGLAADMDRVNAIAAEHGLPVVADGAAALGALYKGGPAGGLGAVTVYSFNGNKTVTAGGGGALASDDLALLERARHLSTTARVGPDYHHDAVGFNYRMTNLQAAVGCAQLERLGPFVARKREIQDRYDRAFEGHPGIAVFPRPEWRESACWLAGITLTDASVGAVVNSLRDRGIEARPFWRPVHLQPPYAGAPRTPQPNTESIWSRVLILPCSTHLTAAEQAEVIAAVRATLTAQAA